MTSVFFIMPYLRVDIPFNVCGITFRSSKDKEGLAPEQAEELDHINSLFYLTEEEPLDEVLYVFAQIQKEPNEFEVLAKKVRSAHTVLSFALINRPFDSYEQMTIFLTVPHKVHVIEEEHGRFVDGYYMTINWRNSINIPRGAKLYPPLPRYLSYQLGLHASDINPEFIHDPLFYDLFDFIDGKIMHHPEQSARFETLLRAMDWYGRSYSQFISKEQEVINIAVSFETLFHETGSQGSIRDEIKRYLRGMFGDVPRLTEWVDQFYGERSRIVHEGFAETLRFVARPGRRKRKPMEMDELVSYGRRILRMCIFTILHASGLSERSKVGAWFTHNQETLETICRELNSSEGTVEERLSRVVSPINDLEVMWTTYSGQRDIQLSTLRTTARLLISNYLEAYPETEESLIKSMEKARDLDLNQAHELHEAYRELDTRLEQGPSMYSGQYWSREIRRAMAIFFKYASSHHVQSLIQALEEEE